MSRRTIFINQLKTELIDMFPIMLQSNPRLKKKADDNNLNVAYFESKDPSYLITLFSSYNLHYHISEMLDDEESKKSFNVFVNNLNKII